MTLLLGSELSSEVDTPVEVDTNSLSISAAAYFAFYCLFLAAFYFWCKLCNWPWEWFHSSLDRAEMHSGAPMKGFSQTHKLSHRDPYQSIFKRCWKYRTAKLRCLEMSAWMLSRIWERKPLTALELFGFFCSSTEHLQNLSQVVVSVLWYFMMSGFLFGMRDF